MGLGRKVAHRQSECILKAESGAGFNQSRTAKPSQLADKRKKEGEETQGRQKSWTLSSGFYFQRG